MKIVRQHRYRRLIRLLYRELLNREPDPEGARVYEDLMLKLGPERAVPRMLEAFFSSEEYRLRAARAAIPHINAALASQSAQLINGRPVNHIVPLGSFCLPTLVCQGNGLRKFSLPFDWIFSTPAMVRDCLADDFAVFLERRHYRSISDPNKEATAEHLFYRERYGIGGLFAHHDPSREDHYRRFVRSVTRFRRILRSQDAKLFLVIGRAHHDLPNEFASLLESLNRATTNFALLCIELLDPIEPGLSSVAPVIRIDHHALYRFTPSSFDPLGTSFPDKLDEWTLLRLVYRYKLALKNSLSRARPSVNADDNSKDFSGNEETEHALP